MNYYDPLTIGVYRNPAEGSYDIYARIQKDGQTWETTRPAEFTIKEPGTYSEPFLRLRPEEAQHLMDDLWVAGVRPTNGQGGPAQVEAMREHLGDLRAIVAKFLDLGAGCGIGSAASRRAGSIALIRSTGRWGQSAACWRPTATGIRQKKAERARP